MSSYKLHRTKYFDKKQKKIILKEKRKKKFKREKKKIMPESLPKFHPNFAQIRYIGNIFRGHSFPPPPPPPSHTPMEFAYNAYIFENFTWLLLDTLLTEMSDGQLLMTGGVTSMVAVVRNGYICILHS